MGLAIARGIVYHSVGLDLSSFARALFAKLSDQSKIERFENEFANYMDVGHCLAFPFARTAIYFALKTQNFPAGSEIIMPPITIKAILDAVLACGLKPVFVDIDPDTLSFDEARLRESVGPSTKAILFTYLLGIVPELDKLLAICNEHSLFVLEDFSQCLNGKYKDKKVGTFGNLGIYSSSFIKTLDTYGGGLAICNDTVLFEALKVCQNSLQPPSRAALLKKIATDIILNLATSRFVFNFLTFPFLRLTARRNPSKIFKHIGDRDVEMITTLPDGWFQQYSSLQAELGLKLLPAVATSDKQRKENVAQLKALSQKANINFPSGAPDTENVYWQLVAYSNDPLATQKFFQTRKVDTSTTSLVQISNLANYPYQGSTPNAERLHSNGLFVPAFPGLKNSEIKHIADLLIESAARKLM